MLARHTYSFNRYRNKRNHLEWNQAEVEYPQSTELYFSVHNVIIVNLPFKTDAVCGRSVVLNSYRPNALHLIANIWQYFYHSKINFTDKIPVYK